jgi:penicillin-binding protein 2
MLIFYLIVEARLWQEQIYYGSKYDKAVSKQSIRRIRKPAPRGRIFSVDRKILADNSPIFNVVFHLAEMRQPGRKSKTFDYLLKAADKAGKAIGRKHALTPEKIQKHRNYTPALPMTVFKNLSTSELAKISEIPTPVPGMEIVTIPQRVYKYRNTACHLLGYIRKDDPSAANDRNDYFYYIPDEKGKKGIEKVYDTSIPEVNVQRRGLRGKPGSSLVMVDFRGFIYKTIGNSLQAQPGHDIILTINFKAQQIAEKLMNNYQGAFVLLNASTGAVITMVSSPGYDISKFMPRLSRKYWGKLINDPKKPLLNRAIAGEYEPGSIIKPVIALSMLENGVLATDKISCPGRSYIGNATIRCGRRSGHGSMDVISALEKSCNVFFIEEGRVLGLEKLAETLASMGVGKKTEFPLYERSGLLPSRADLYYKTGRKWNVFDTALISIGQGNIHVTPLQAALFTAAIANGGTLWRPYLLKEVLDPKGNTIYISKPFPRAELNIDKEILAVLHKGMYNVVHAAGGSGKRANSKKITLHGKTGTAEKGKGANRTKNTWFIGFGTDKETTYALAIFVENGISGGKTCAPIAKAFFDTWLK